VMVRFDVKKTIGIVLASLMLVAAGTAHAESDQQLMADANATKAAFKKGDIGLKAWFDKAPGYVIFPGVGKAGLGIGGAHGTGVVYQKGHPVGKATLNQVSIGAQVGGQEYAEVIFFETPAALDNFMQGNFAFSGAISAVALKSGASANARYKDGVAVFTATKGGLMLEASVGGQKFGYEPF
jgi:lipid-binding SYLF domain-containing protein